MKEERSAKQQDVQQEKEEVNPINNITNMIINNITNMNINKMIFTHLPRRRRSLPGSKMRR